ncbi:MAG: tetratricopeptide repeat protein [Pirellulaceae bacterium]
MKSTALVVFFLLSMGVPTNLSAQNELVQRIEAVAAQSKSAKTATEYSAIIAECESILNEPIDNTKHRQYVNSLTAWALELRARSRVDLADQFRRAGNETQADQVLSQAIQDFDQAIEHDPDHWKAWMNRGALQASQGQFQKALEDFGRVEALKPDHVDAVFNRAEMHVQLGDFASALADYDRVLQTNPDDWPAVNGRAGCLLNLDRADEAIAEYDRLVSKQPNSAWALANRSDAQIALNNWTAARIDLENAVQLQPDSTFYRRLAWLLATCPDEQFCDGEAALVASRKAIELGGESLENLETLAAAFAANGDFDRARDTQTRVIGLAEGDAVPEQTVRQTVYEGSQRFEDRNDN